MLVAAGMFFGWRGLLVGGILLYVYTANQQPQPAPNPAGTNRRMAAAQDYFQQMLGQAPLGRGGTAAGSGGRAPNIWMGMKVGQARKKYGITYPTLYAPPGHKDEKAFNCVQRAHQNSLENLPSFYALLLTAGIKASGPRLAHSYLISASIAGAVALVGRIFFFNGYSTGDPKARYRGGFTHFGTLALLGMVIGWSAQLLAPVVGL
ncbi:hypothetical protein CHLNCDRAFT_135580 [Chlorella variabilis]|uniref:Glutathione transferase n=1 Tax=Chlorella variabilis TaxID=554065 RepID=E1ZII1_CHLVA|nr:hypothetical protein CHLNCDRAFT_135580 [Chlorella variabilis]EFN54337.1 hypothetical protein CHLNCDRAFT_135580 [Chlorella variabilis]|eukprot:XP_005846439.1 hypothetical protein CHLNCDRAFT_135580 [Chlorella variabilis]